MSRIRWLVTRILLFAAVGGVFEFLVGQTWASVMMWTPIVAVLVYAVFEKVRGSIEARLIRTRRQRLWAAPDPWRN